ncbi:MAG: HAMP domain-containing sensor histidine kinase [Parcubacteria group bacterium]|jgi:signal transduction histidine kinase
MNYPIWQKIKRKWYYPTMVIILLALGFLSTLYVYSKINSFEKESLLKRSDSLSKAFDLHEISTLEGNENDLHNSQYISVKEKLINIKKVNPDVRFVYLTGMKGDQVYFIADSEDPDSGGYSPPGEAYPEASPEFKAIFGSGKSLLEGPLADRWGRWISALSPILDSDGQEVAAVVGMDIEAGNYLQNVWLYSSVPIFATVILIAFIITGWLIGRKEEKIMEIKSEMVSMASHDIRSPLAGILWSFEKLHGESDNFTEKQILIINSIESTCRNLLNTLNDFLLASPAAEMGKLISRKDDVAVLIREIADDLALSAQKSSIKIIFEESFPNKLILEFDSSKMERALSNIIDNAIKYSRQGSEVRMGYKKEDEFHVFSIKDKGIGIAEEDEDKIFRGFFRAENAKKNASIGTGLGLYYAKKIIELHGGKVWFESVENSGTTFFVALK